jgi:TatD DNase family protein
VIDTHAHLDECDDLPAALIRARSAGVTRIITIGTGIDSCRAALAIADREDGVCVALGIDPHQAASAEAGRIGELRDLLAHPKAVAVGETGLDNHHRFASPLEQRRLLDAHLALAADLGKPVVIHSRDAAAETTKALADFEGTVVLHCFSSPDLLPVAVDRGYFVSFAGNVTFPKASELREAAAHTPANRILVETDSPYLSPQPVRGRPNEPANLVHTIAALAAVRGEEPGHLAKQIDRNADEAFAIGRRAP